MFTLSRRGITRSTIFLALACGYASSSTLAAEDEVIRTKIFSAIEGSTVSIPSDRVGLLVDYFHMGDHSRINLPKETSLFFIRAKKADIGNKTLIVSEGKDGGRPGEPGLDAPTFVLIMENVESPIGLTIEGIGGAGSNGERGRKGPPGRAARCGGDGAGNGGRGGAGTSGGNAGNGGNAFLIVPNHAKDLGVSFRLGSGRHGTGGPGGPGGDGGRGKKKCGVWPYWKRGPGSSGPVGPNGPDGQEGRSGESEIYYVSDFQEKTVSKKLEGIISWLQREGYSDDANTLRSVISKIIQSSN